MADRWMDEREELERMDRERGYGRYRRERDDYRFDRGLYGDRSFDPREERVFGERESGVDYTNPRRDYGYDARMSRRSGRGYGGERGRFASREDMNYGGGGDYAPITRGGAYGYAPRPYGGDRYEDERRREERAYRIAYGEHHADHAGHYEEPERRSFWERAGDRVASWLGEEGAGHRGRGPTGYKRTDERISEEAHERLTEDPWLDASGITILVASGEVTLAGVVPEREAKHRAERLVEDLSGVTHVQNNLRIRRDEPSPGTGFGEGAAHASPASSRKN